MSNVTKAICESLVCIELLRRGWHVVNLNAVNNTPNADLIAIRGERRITLQVKGMDGGSDKIFRHHVAFSRTCGDYLNNGIPFFNRKESIVVADFFVGVTQAPDIQPTFAVMPISAAENMARRYAEWYSSVPKRDGTKRSPNFAAMVAIRPAGIFPNHPTTQVFHNEISPYINSWHVLE